MTALFLAGCWISPSDWDEWDIKHGEFDTAEVEGDTDTDVDADSDSDADSDTDVDVVDDDGDGFSEADGDCNDDDSSINPDAEETWYDGVDQDCSGGSDYDQDGDGHDSDAHSGDDCDDTDADVSPSADETCNGIDDDCDGDSDEDDAVDATTWYADGDGDGFGDTLSTLAACEQPTGYIADGTDCDDAESTVNPLADEYCDSVDNDCDGTVDEPEALDASTWYQDSDGDGYGDGTSSTTACSEPSGYSTDATDCDDGDVSVNPAAEDDCGDGIDQDCSGDDLSCRYTGTFDLGTYGVKLIGEDAADYAAYSVASAGDVNADGFDDLLIGATGDDGGGAEAGAAYLVYGPVTADLDLSAADAKLIGENPEDHAGMSVASGGDVDGDGSDDLLVSAPFNDDGGSNAGAAYLVYGPVTADLDLSSADAKLTGEGADDYVGYSALAAGDVNSDGIDDLLLGAQGGGAAGAAYLVYGPVTADLDLSSADAKLTGEASGDAAGASVSVGDLNGDGYSDLIVGAYGSSDGGSYAGAAYLVYGPVTADLDLSAADAKLIGENAGDYAGWSIASAGDVDADGHDDLLIGAYGNDDGGGDAGAAYLVYGPLLTDLDLSAADAKLIGEDPDDRAGISVASAGDVDADGHGDLLVGAEHDDDGGVDAGAAYLVYGPVTANTDLSAAHSKLIGEDVEDYAGSSGASAGDMDADGYGDLLVGAYYDDDGGTEAGAAYLLLFADMP